MCSSDLILLSGHVQTGTYEKDGVKMPFFEVVAEEQEFAETTRVDNAEGRGPLHSYLIERAWDWPGAAAGKVHCGSQSGDCFRNQQGRAGQQIRLKLFPSYKRVR